MCELAIYQSTHLQRLSSQHGPQKQSIRLEGEASLSQSTLAQHTTSATQKVAAYK
jgi:hypothetical protein